MFFLIKGIAYFAIGSIIGLLSWVISQAYYGGSELTWMLWLMMPFGFLVSGTIAITEEVLESDRKFSAFFQQMYWFLIGGILGMIGGAMATLLGRWVFYAITENSQSILLARVCGMFILGTVIGVAAGLTEKFRMGSWDRCFSIILAGAFGGIFGGILRHYLTKISGKLDFLGLTIVMFGGILVIALIIVTKLRTPAVLRGHRDNFGVKYGEGFEYPMPSDVDLWIGSGMRERSSQKTRLKIYADNKVDKIQCIIGMKEEGWTLVQAPEFPRYGSHTYINDKQIKGRTRLRDGDILMLGQTKFVFKLVSDENAPKKQRKRSGRTLGIIFLFILALLAPVCDAEDNSFVIVPDKKIATGNYPEFTVPFRMVDAESGEVLPVKIDETSLDPSKWRVEDTEGVSLGDVISVRPIDEETDRDKLFIILLIDLSKTMDIRVGGSPDTRLEQAIRVAAEFVEGVRENCYVALVPFAATFREISPRDFMGPEQRTYLVEKVQNLKNYRGNRMCTALYPSLSRSVRTLYDIQDKNIKKAVILLTDGYNDLDDVGKTYNCKVYKKIYHPDELDENALTAQLRDAQIPVFAFGFNLPEEKEKEEYLRSLTLISNRNVEERFFKDSGKSLRAVYDRLDNVTKAKRFILTFRTNLSPNVFVDPPDYYIFTDSFSGSYESAPARAMVEFFALPRGELEDEIKTRVLTFGLAFVVICLLFIIQAFVRIQMYARVKAKESQELPDREVRSRRPQPRYSVKKMGDGRAINVEGASVRPDGVDISGSREDIDRPLTRPVTKPTATKPSKQPQQAPAKEKPGTGPGPPPAEKGKHARYEHVPLPEPPSTPSLPDIDDDVPDWLKGADDDDFS